MKLSGHTLYIYVYRLYQDHFKLSKGLDDFEESSNKIVIQYNDTGAREKDVTQASMELRGRGHNG